MKISYSLQTTVLVKTLMVEACSIAASRTLSITKFFASSRYISILLITYKMLFNNKKGAL